MGREMAAGWMPMWMREARWTGWWESEVGVDGWREDRRGKESGGELVRAAIPS